MKSAAKIFALALLSAWVCGVALGAQSPLSAAKGSGVVSGVLVSGVNGETLADAGVTLLDVRDGKEVAETSTDPEGRFSFANVPDGRYELRASHRGFVTADFEDHDGYSTAIVTGEGLDTTGLRFTLEAQAAIYGTVTEDSGDPVPNARVSLYRRTGSGRIVRANVTGADAMGHFELPHLTPGAYYLCAAGEPWYRTHRQPVLDQQGNPTAEQPKSSMDVAYRLTFYPDSSDSNAAEPVEVKAGDRVEADFTLHPVPAVHISVQIPSPPGQQHGGGMGVQFSENVFGVREIIQTGAVAIFNKDEADGSSVTTMEISGVAPGEYEVEVPSPTQVGGPRPYTTIDATSDHASLDLSSISSLAEVSGKVSMAGGASLPDGLSVVLEPGEGDGEDLAQVKADGSFQFGAVHAGSYSVLLNSNGRFLFVTQLNASGGKADGRRLEVGGDPVALTLVAAEANATVKGFAYSNGKPAPEVFVVLVPADAKAGREALRADQTDSDGSFNLYRVIPGAYTLVAVEKGWTLDWAQPGAMARYLAKGEKVDVRADGKQIDTKEPVDVQPK
jgi:hypothetical protein